MERGREQPPVSRGLSSRGPLAAPFASPDAEHTNRRLKVTVSFLSRRSPWLTGRATERPRVMQSIWIRAVAQGHSRRSAAMIRDRLEVRRAIHC
jgi:hypothetical protein